MEHQLRVDRHARRTAARDAEQGAAFNTALAKARGALLATLDKLAGLAALVPAQTNMAALSGIAAKGRALKASLAADTAAAVATLTSLAAANTAKLIASGDDFIAACVLFDKGGEFDSSELDAVRVRLGALHETLKEASTARQALAAELNEAVAGSAARFDALNAAVEDTQQTLALKEGLGSKYGGPRRAAQVKEGAALGAGSEET